jgi:hypothetical protein
MWGLIVVLGLVAVVVLVGVLVALGMRASRSGGDDDWMAEDEQPRGRRGGRSRGRRGEPEEYEYEDEPYGDMRVAGAPNGAPQQLPAAPMAGPMAGPPPGQHAPLPAVSGPNHGPGPAPAPSGRSNDEMDDDEYWSTITFDKPKFPWRQNGEQPPEQRGNDPLAPTGPPQGQSPDAHPMDNALPPAPPTTPQPAVPASALDAPVGRGGETDPGAVPSYGSAEQSGGFAPYGSEPQQQQPQQQNNGYGDDPLNTGERPSYGSGSGSSSYGSPSYGSPSTGGGAPSAGSGWSDSSSSSSSYGSDPLSGGYSSTGGGNGSGSGGGYGSSSYDSGYGSSGSGYSSGDSSSSPYGSTPHQDDPLGGGYPGSSSSDSYGSSGGGYSSSDFGGSGSSYGNGGSSSYGDSNYYPGQQGYDSGTPQTPPPPSDNSTQAYPTSPYGNSYGSNNDRDKDERQDDWNSYNDYRR